MSVNEKNPLTIEHANVSSNYSHIPLNAILAGTNRFGEVSPHFVARVVASDKRARFMSGTDTRSLNLVSPVMQDVKMHKTYGMVPMPAILPLNWDKLYVQPNIGDDVVASNVGTTSENWFGILTSASNLWFNNIIADAYDTDSDAYYFSANHFANIIKWLNCLSGIFSAGSLSSQFGNNYWSLFKATDTSGNEMNFDQFYDWLIGFFIKEASSLDYKFFVTFDSGVSYYEVVFSLSEVSGTYFYNNVAYQRISFRRFLELVRDNPNFDCAFGYDAPSEDLTFEFASDVFQVISIGFGDRNKTLPELPLNLDVYAAYQLFVAEYMTNDKVDYVYSSELYRQVMRSALKTYFANSSDTTADAFTTFSWNGNSYLYDEFSAFMFEMLLSALLVDVAVSYAHINSTVPYFIDCWNLIFNVRNSLRYGDYFTGAKTRPLAPIDVNVPVVGGNVSMVDIARQKGYLRLAFAVNRIGRKLSKYSEEIMHSAPPTDYHHAWYLAETTDTIGATDTENTNIDPSASNQPSQSTISNIRSQSNQYAFETDVDINGVLIGVTSYDINRLYDRGISRFNWHVDRYDMFNPLLQFTGDQDIKSSEIDVTCKPLSFAYTVKYGEYKFPINRCFGGLCLDSVLPGWVMRVTDRFDSAGAVGLTPSFIRSYPYEFDKFYLSLTGMSPASYFHFIVKHSNAFEVDRPMVASPKIM